MDKRLAQVTTRNLTFWFSPPLFISSNAEYAQVVRPRSGFPAHGCPISETPVWEVVKDRMMLNQPVVPEDDGIGLPLHSDLRRNAGADGVKKEPKQELGFGFSEPIDATGEPSFTYSAKSPVSGICLTMG